MASAADYSSDSSLSPIDSPRPISVPSSNPTEILQHEYANFIKRGKHRSFNVELSLSEPSCSRDDFYFALFAMDESPRSMQLIKKCAESVGNPADPVDAAIRCYSILIRNLYTTEKRTLADVVVCDFLKSLPRQESDKISKQEKKDYIRRMQLKKMQCLYLILTDRAAYDAAPKEIKDEILTGLSTSLSSLRRILSIQPQGSNDVVQANAILQENGLTPVVYSEEDFNSRKKSKSEYGNMVVDVFGQYAGGRKLKLKLRSKSKSSKNKKNKTKNKNRKKTLRLRIKK